MKVIRHWSLSGIGAFCLPSLGLVAFFELFLILGRRNLRRFNIWNLESNDLIGYYSKPSPYSNSVFHPCLHFCLGPYAVLLKNWILGDFILVFSFTLQRLLLLNLILITESLSPSDKILCLPVADNHLNILVVKIYILCTYSNGKGNMAALW